MQLKEFLTAFDYAKSPNYLDLSINQHHGLSIEPIFRSAKKAGIQGTYVIHTSPPEQEILPIKPAVYLAEVQTVEEARKIHRCLWNLGTAPFFVALLPHQIRVYTGFNFSIKEENQGLIEKVDQNDIESIKNQLSYLLSESIDSGYIWKEKAKFLRTDKRVDIHLLNNLDKLNKRLREKGLDLSVAHSLIGKYVYIRYLRDRDILSDNWLKDNEIDLNDVLTRNANLNGLNKLIKALEKQFNGSLFPLELEENSELDDDIVSLVASVFKGDDPETGQLHLDFELYDFSYIPVETLSSIYEQFLRNQGENKKQGAVYTPEPLADYLIAEINSVKPLKVDMKILDPCSGSGIFLVLTYRRLIELELQAHQTVAPDKLKEILLNSIYGVERNLDACYVTEFSLILTMLNYIEPPDLHKNKDFKFPILHNQRIFQCDFFDDNSQFWQENIKFDWILGNPPWIELKPKTQGEEIIREWISEHQKEQPIAGNKVCEAFTWRVTEFIKSDGYIGLIIHATSLFNHESGKYRQAFFTQNEIARVTNFSNLAYVLFGGRGEAPAANLIYTKASDDRVKPPIIHYAPFVVNQIVNRPWQQKQKNSTWNISINENEINTISADEAATGEAIVWKLALWGTYRDKRAIKRLSRLFKMTLGELAEQREWNLCQGLRLIDANTANPNSIEYIDILNNYKCLNASKMIKSERRFSIPDNSLEIIHPNKCYVPKRKAGLSIIKAPHLVLTTSYSAYSDKDFVIPHPKVGLSGSNKDAHYLSALSFFLESSICKYDLFFTSSSWGVGRNVISPKDVKKIRIPNLTSEQIQELSNLQEQLAEWEEQGLYSADELQGILDDAIERILKLPKNISLLAREFMQIRLKLNKGKATGKPVQKPTEEELKTYGQCLANELDNFTDDSSIHHKVSIVYSNHLIICTVELINSNQPIDVMVEKATPESSVFLQGIQQKLKQQFSQWVYVQKGLRIFDDSKIHICKPPRLIDWTQTQALLDSDDVIAEIMSLNQNFSPNQNSSPSLIS